MIYEYVNNKDPRAFDEYKTYYADLQDQDKTEKLKKKVRGVPNLQTNVKDLFNHLH